MAPNKNSTHNSESHTSKDESIHGRQHWAHGRAALTIGEVADACGVSKKTILRWIELEGLPVIRRAAAGARPIMLVTPNDLDDWLLDARHESSTSEDEPTIKIERFRFLPQNDLDIENRSRSSVSRHQRRTDQ